MKRRLPFFVLAAALLYLGTSLVPPRDTGRYNLAGFSRLPVLVNGRVKPLDTVARTSLLALQGRQRVTSPNGTVLSPAGWLAEMMLGTTLADACQTFEIVHPDVLTLFHLEAADGAAGKRFSMNQLSGHLDELQRQFELAQPIEPAVRTPFQKAVVKLFGGVILYQGLRHSVQVPDGAGTLADLIGLRPGIAVHDGAARTEAAGQPADAALVARVQAATLDAAMLDTYGSLRLLPPAREAADQENWGKVGAAVKAHLEGSGAGRELAAYAALAGAWRSGQPDAFNSALESLGTELRGRTGTQWLKSEVEVRFNAAAPFYRSMVLFFGAFALAVLSWLKWPEELGRSAYRLVVAAFIVTTAGIALRMWIEGRPPVTNLYSSALFVGWGAVGLCVLLEAVYRNAVGSVAAGIIGFCTLLIAHFLSLQGDTMEMMRAVLDSNFWLATHVVTVTVGYSATYLAGFLALIYVVRGVCTRSLDTGTADALARMVYGIVCFATLFSLIGTVLGGIWADQSWGRFWGWDPKENGALIIVLWNALILHARWGGLVRQRGLMNLAIFGNIVTSWSWFGVNMLGVGLHSYGFMDAAFWWLMAFAATQIAAIGMGMIPASRWRSLAAR